MAQTVVNAEQLKATQTALTENHTLMMAQLNALKETMETTFATWTGEAASKYRQSYERTLPDFEALVAYIGNAAATMDRAIAQYKASEQAVNEVIQTGLSK